MTRTKLLSISIISFLFLSSCSSANTNVPEQIDISVNNHTYQAAPPDAQSEESDPNLFPDHFSDIENEYITADAEVTMPSEFEKDTVLNTYHSVYMEWEDERIISDLTECGLVPGKTVTDKKVYDSREKIAGTERVKYVLDDDSYIIFQSGEISYSTPKSRNASYDQDINRYLNNESRISIEETANQHLLDAVTAADGILEKAGVPDKVTDPEVYLISGEKTIAENENSDNETDETFSEEEYIVVYPVVTHGLPSSGLICKNEDEVLDSSIAYFIYSHDEISEFKINGMIKSSAVAQEAKILSPVHAFNLLRRSYDDTHKCSITSIELVSINRIVYKSDSVEIITEPVWMLSGKYTDAGYTDQSIVTYVSAVSGEVIPVCQITE